MQEKSVLSAGEQTWIDKRTRNKGISRSLRV